MAVTSHWSSSDAKSWPALLAKNGTDVYRRNLENLVKLLKAQGRTVLIVPQHYTPRTDADKFFVQGVREHNQVNAEVARQLAVPFAQETIQADAFADNHTFDSCHFNDAGHAKMAHLVFQRLEHEQLIPHRK
jgi:hypothetical protein